MGLARLGGHLRTTKPRVPAGLPEAPGWGTGSLSEGLHRWSEIQGIGEVQTLAMPGQRLAHQFFLLQMHVADRASIRSATRPACSGSSPVSRRTNRLVSRATGNVMAAFRWRRGPDPAAPWGSPTGVHQATPPPAVAGNRSFPALAGQLVTIEQTEQLRDDAGL